MLPTRLLADRTLFIDAEAMIVDKPAGLPVDAPRDGALSVMNHLESLRFGFERLPLIVHRLDRDTSGCLLLARNPRIQKKLSQAFEDGSVEKTYLAMLDGVPDGDSGSIDCALAKVSTRETGWRMVPDAKGQRAVTHWQLLATREGQALVRFTPETGRTHQLRVHAASGIGVPIVGDPVYGQSGAHMLLHAESLSAPRTGKAPVAARSPLPEHFPDWARDALA
ncbi:MAG: RluA family pseudouridine synthase [Sphingomonadaceae bacterium]